MNALGTRHVAEAARRYGSHLVVLSTDYVFDGTAKRPYVEWDETRPLSVYGRSKLGAEHEAGPEATIVRTSWVSGVPRKEHRAHDSRAVGDGRLTALRGRPTRMPRRSAPMWPEPF